jgi:DNA polymerase III subunit beta
MVSMTVFSIFWLRPFFQILTLLATPIENGARSQLSVLTDKKERGIQFRFDGATQQIHLSIA